MSAYPIFPIKDRYAYFWLAIGFALSFFATGRWVLAPVVWVASIFLMRFMRTQRVLPGFLFIAAASIIATVVTWQDLMVPLPMPIRIVTLVMIGVTVSLFYLADRVLVARWQGADGRYPFAATLIFPSVMTAVEFLGVGGNPMGTFGATAYTQYGNLPLMQLVSLTGLWGLTFLIGWLAPVANWAWERNLRWPEVRLGVFAYGGVLALVLLYGSARLALAPTPGETVQVTALTTVSVDMRQFNQLSEEERRAQLQATYDAYLEATRRAARDGSRLVAWAELSGVHMSGEREALLADVKAVARQENVYVAINTMGGATPDMATGPDVYREVENKLWIIDPAGNVLLEQMKFGGNEFEVWSIPGDGILHLVETPFGTVAGGICWDLDFPSAILQAGRNGADILLGPSHDRPFWEMGKERLHAEMAVFRAIENGASLVRPADYALSNIADPYGRVLAEQAYDPAGNMVITAAVPTRGVTTLYSRVGDAFAYSAILLFLVLAAAAVRAGRRQATVGSGQLAIGSQIVE
jgi:apolipoprotein N-acyltransferase